ncbi:GntR family transcriptional regulator [Aeromicrobium senzhongii]|uniref:GntR family transcriptional regulator n=1 Tax=Aeromicrobium senzhongii TaxID=2663859 RepID=A0ABX6SQX0_9ACTN|nr:GntR family transcriptional regulator [Aeromicrobium senzhongii]MTB88949.1 FCD domain-containing protein [Aeromicrobium senzhongii]QNL93769.1 GntR family transcriptional regulator [Aeromicrobium senzhongii]
MADPVTSSVRAPKRQQLPEEVAAYVRELIISGDVKPGEFLRIEPIAEAVGVSNTPVREGLLALRSQGFVRLAPRRGFVVAPFSQQDVRDLFWAQAQLGGELAARAAKKISPESIKRLEEFNEQYTVAVKNRDAEAVADLGHRFHREINLAADSQRLALLLGSVVRHLPNRFYANIEGQVDQTQGDHPKLLEALRAGDSRKARSLMEKHIEKGGERLIETLQARGVWSGDSTS